jgi:hypothetical protein
MRQIAQKLKLLVSKPALALFAFTALLVVGMSGSYFLSGRAAAVTNSTINFQARLMNATGSIIPDGTYNIEFKLYNALTSSGSSQGSCTGDSNCVWTETYTTGTHQVSVANGYVSVSLGSVTSFPTTIKWDQQLWLTMRVGGTSGTPSWDTEMSPRLQLTAAPYAFRAGQLASLSGTSTAVLQFAATIGQDSTITLPDPGTSTPVSLCYQNAVNNNCLSSSTGVQLQASTPGTQQTGFFNISGTGIAGTSLLTLLLDTPASGNTLAIGTTNATGGINLNQNVTIAAGKSLTFASGAGNFDQSNSTGTFATGSGNVSLNGNTSVASGKTLTVTNGTTSFTYNGTSDANTIALTSTSGTQTNGIVVNRNGTGGTTTNGINITQTAGTLTNGLSFSGTIGTDINRSSGTLSLQGNGGVTIAAGSPGATSTGGTVSVTSGAGGSTSGNSGLLTLQSGSVTSGTSGNILLDTGSGSTTGTPTINIGTGNAGAINIGNTTSSTATTLSGLEVIRSVAANSFNALQVQRTNSDPAFTFSTQNGIATFGNVTTNVGHELVGQLTLADGGHLGYGNGLTTATLTASQVLTMPNLSGTIFVLQSGTPASSVSQVGNVHLSGTGIADAGLQSPNLDSTSGALAIGGTNASSVAIGHSAVTTAISASNFNLLTSGQVTLHGGLSPDITTGVTGGVGAALALQPGTSTGTNNGAAVSLQGGASGTGAAVAGGTVLIQGGTANGTGVSSGGTVTIQGGTPAGTGLKGLIQLNGATYFTTGTYSNSGPGTVAVPQSLIDSNSAIQLTAGVAGMTYTVSAPQNSVSGRVLYVTNAGTFSFTLSYSGTTFTLNPGSTSVLMWNAAGSIWTSAGGDISTLQEAYSNSIGGTTPEILLDNTRNGLSIQDSNSGLGSSVPLLAVRASASANTLGTALFVVNNNGGTPLVGIGTGSNTPSRTLDIAVSNSTVNAPPLLVEQANAAGDSTIEFRNNATGESFYAGQDSDTNTYSISSSNAAASSPTTISQVQSRTAPVANLPNGNTGTTLAYSSNTTAGNLLVATATFDTTHANSVTCSDNAGNTWSTAVLKLDVANGDGLAVCYAPNITGGADTVKFVFNSASTVNSVYLSIQEYSGAATAGPVDVTASNVSSGTNTTSTSATTTQNGDLIFGTVYNDSGSGITITAGGGFTQRTLNTAVMTEDKTLSSAGSTAATNTFSVSEPYISIMVAFRAVTTVTDNFASPLFMLQQSGAATFRNVVNSTAGFAVQNATGAANLLTVDTTNNQVVLGTSSSLNGQLAFATTSGGTLTLQPTATSSPFTLTLPAETGTVCTNATAGVCSAASTGFIRNQTTVQNGANLYTRSAALGSVVATFEGASGQTADLLDFNTYNGTSSTKVASVDSSGNLTLLSGNLVLSAAGGVEAIGAGASNGTSLKIVSTSSQNGITVQNSNTSASNIAIIQGTGQSSRSLTYSAAGTFTLNAGSNQTTADLVDLQNAANDGATLAKFDSSANFTSYGTNVNNSGLAIPNTPTITTGTSGTAFYYVVTATNNQGETMASGSVGLTADTGITIAWTQVPGATGYKVYRNTSNSFATGSLLAATITKGSTLSFSDTNITTTAGLPPTAPTGTTTTLQGWSGQTAAVLAVTSAPTSLATSSLIQLGSAIAGGNNSANGGTYLGINEPSSGSGSAADFLNFQNNGSSKVQISSTGAVTIASNLTFATGANQQISVATQTTSNTAGNNLTTIAATGNGNGNGGNLIAQGGTGGATGTGGSATLQGGTGGATNGAGGVANVTGGTAIGAFSGGAANIQGGTASATAGSNGGGVTIAGANGTATGTGGTGGAILLNGGSAQGSGNNNGGTVIAQLGAATGTGVQGTFQIQNALGASLLTLDPTNTAASLNIAVNPGAEVSGTFGTTWTAHGAATITRDTTSGEFASGTAGVKAATSAAATQGVRNNVGTVMSASTGYVVSFSIKVSAALTNANLSVVFSPDGTTSNNATCSTLSTTYGSISTSSFIKYTCTLTTTSTTTTASAYLAIFQADATARNIFVDNLSIVAQNNAGSQDTGDLKIGGASSQGLTLLTLDTAAGTPFTGSNASLAGSMYFDTTAGKIQCYDGSSWGACGAAPNGNVVLTPEYAGAVLDGSGIGTLTSDFCANSAALTVGTLCATNDARNFYKWTSPQATSQSYNMYVTYKLPSTFKNFVNGTTTMTGLVDNTSNADVQYAIFKSTGGAITACSAAKSVINGGSANTWITTTPTTDPSTGGNCNFAAGNNIIFQITVTAKSSASAYAENLSFQFTNQ